MQKFAAQDLLLHHKVMEAHAVRGLDRAAVTVRSVDEDADKYISCIWGCPLDGAAPVQLTRGPGLDTTPRWSPDGRRLAFLSDRSGASQLFVLDLSGGEARQLTRFDMGVTQFEWFPDSSALVANVPLAVDPDRRGQRGGPVRDRKPNSPQVAWKLPYKQDGVGYTLAREIHMFRIDLESGDAKQLTDGPFDVQAFQPSPDGRHIAFSRNREGRFAHRTDLWVCDADGQHARQLTEELATAMKPWWSTDGRFIAFGGARVEGDGQTHLWVLDFSSGELRSPDDEQLEVAEAEWMMWVDGGHLLVTRARRGRHELVRVSAADGEVTLLVTGCRQFGAVACNGEQLVFSADAPDQPSEVFACRLDGSDERRISNLNPWWRERTPLAIEDREFTVPDGRGGRESIHGWLQRPRDRRTPGPLVDDAHGGPAAYALLDFDTNVYWQVLCSQGWSVLLLNPVGSASFGREFCERLSGHWGELDLPQHQQAVRQLKDEGVCDQRVAIVGKSYGGFLASWAIGHTDDFRAAVVMAPVGNIETHYGTSDGGYYADPLYVDAAPGFDRQRARELSPLQYVERATTPTLFLQGTDDERCPKCQSEELFVSLYRAGDTPAELVLYPGENHHFLGEGAPSTRVDACERIAGWVSRHVGAPAQARAPHVSIHATSKLKEKVTP
jgi:dipeptidyl aminopeptidase/acylaminoacyl peptidase